MSCEIGVWWKRNDIRASTRSELRGASCEDWKSAFSVVPREDSGIKIEDMSSAELKAKLKEMNIHIRLRSLDKLRQLLKDAIYASSRMTNLTLSHDHK
jgi:hypothetical protein